MPDQKISELTPGTPQAADQFVIARSTSNLKVDWSAIAAAFSPAAHASDMANPHGVTAAQAGADPAGTAAAEVASYAAADFQPYRWAIKTGNNGTYPGGFAPKAASATRLLARCTGGNCTVTVNKGGALLTGFTAALTAGVTQDITPTAQAIAGGEYLELVVSLASADVDLMATLVTV